MNRKKINYVKNIDDAKLYDIMPPFSKDGFDYLYTNIISFNDILADIGSGTGRLTKELINRGNVVYAVEPDIKMKIVCDKKLRNNKNYYGVDGSAENSNLPNKSIDCILVSQALHRFNITEFIKESERILKKPGNIIIIWNRIDFEKEIFSDLLKLIKKVYPNYRSRYDEDEISGTKKEILANNESVKELLDGNNKMLTFKNEYLLDKKKFSDLVLSLGLFPLYNNSENSKLLDSGEIDVLDLEKGITEIFDKYSKKGMISLPFTTDFHFNGNYEKEKKS